MPDAEESAVRGDGEEFGPEDMAAMTPEEWEAAFDPESWITGSDLLDRLEADLKDRVASRDVFARVERLPDPDRLVAYSDEGYAVVFEDGSVEGHGTVLRDVKPSVALCSMPGYDVPDLPEGNLLPEPMEVPEASGELGNRMVQLIAAAQVLAGVGLLAATVVAGGGLVTLVAGLGFLVFGIFMFLVVANARLSDRFRAEEYRNRLRAVGVESGTPPETLPADLRENLLDATGDDDSHASDDDSHTSDDDSHYGDDEVPGSDDDSHASDDGSDDRETVTRSEFGSGTDSRSRSGTG